MLKFSKVKLENEFVVDMNSILGKGSTGCVYEGYDQKTKAKVAVKVIELNTIDNEVTEYLLKMQKKALMQLASPYVLKGLRIFQDNRFCFMVTEFCNGGTLKKLIKDKGFLGQQQSLKIVKQILEGYKNLVDHKVVHRDLKPANIMMHNESPKIIDFGYCQIQGYQKPRLQYNVGSPSYMAPESYQLNIYNQKTEIWSIGVILYQCLTGRTIDEGIKMTEIYKLLEKSGVPYPDFVSASCRQIINWCLNKDPWNRPTCSQLLQKFFGCQSLNMIDLPNENTKILQSKDRLTQKTIDTERSTRNLPMTSSKIFNLKNVFETHSIENIKTSQFIERPKTIAFVNNVEGCQPLQQTTNRMRAAYSVHEKSSKALNFVQPHFQNRIEQGVFNKQHQRNVIHHEYVAPKENKTYNRFFQQPYYNQHLINPYHSTVNTQQFHHTQQIPTFPNNTPFKMNQAAQMVSSGRERPQNIGQRVFTSSSQYYPNYAQRQRTISFRI